jgi:hypothetical protein
MNSSDRWQLLRTTHFPEINPFFIISRAGLSISSPIETLPVGYYFFLLAKSSILLVGSAPAESKKRIGLLGSDSSQS